MIAWVVSKRLLSYAFRYENEIRQSGLEKHKNTVEKCHTFAPPVNGNSRYCPYIWVILIWLLPLDIPDLNVMKDLI